MNAYCEYGKHEVENVTCQGALYCYTDTQRNIKDISICKDCLFDHVAEYYPNSPNELSLIRMYPELESRRTSHTVERATAPEKATHETNNQPNLPGL